MGASEKRKNDISNAKMKRALHEDNIEKMDAAWTKLEAAGKATNLERLKYEAARQREKTAITDANKIINKRKKSTGGGGWW